MPNQLDSLLDEGAALLKAAGIENPRLAAELFIRSLLSLRRIDIHLDPMRQVSPDIVEAYRGMITRKLNREPLQYIIGETEWFGLTIKCDHRALVPRPETEIVVERALEQIREIKNPRIADIGTGTGCIAIAFATLRPDATVVATDQSKSALGLAAENFRLHGVDRRIATCIGDALEALSGEQTFDLIISNPPYIRESEYPGLMPEVRDFEPREALVAGLDGLDVIRNLVAGVADYLNPDGYLVLEYGIDHDDPIRELVVAEMKMSAVETIVDYNQRNRGIVLRKSI